MDERTIGLLREAVIQSYDGVGEKEGYLIRNLRSVCGFLSRSGSHPVSAKKARRIWKGRRVCHPHFAPETINKQNIE